MLPGGEPTIEFLQASGDFLLVLTQDKQGERFALGIARGLFDQSGWFGFVFVPRNPCGHAQVGPAAVGSGQMMRTAAFSVRRCDLEIDFVARVLLALSEDHGGKAGDGGVLGAHANAVPGAEGSEGQGLERP